MAAIIAALLAVLATAAWEMRVRSIGYGPTLNDTSDLWSARRSQVGTSPDQTVIVGSSRIQFDLDLQTYARYFDTETPIQLAMAGTNPTELLESVADAGSFDGTLVLGVSPGLWFVPQGRPVESARQAVGRFRNWSPSQKLGLTLGKPLQRQFAFINQNDLRLGTLLDRWKIENRPGAATNIPPVIPPYFATVDEDRQARMWEQCDFGTPLAQRIQNIWIPLFTPPPPPPIFTKEEFSRMMAANVEAHLQRMRVAVEALRARGVRVVFVRPPSTGTLREIERRTTPREAFYDRMLVATGAPGIHFEDYPELAAFDCPEWSHLTAKDALEWSEALMPILERVLAGG